MRPCVVQEVCELETKKRLFSSQIEAQADKSICCLSEFLKQLVPREMFSLTIILKEFRMFMLATLEKLEGVNYVN